MKLTTIMVILGLTASTILQAQTPTQTIRGKVFDADSKTGLPGAHVILLNSQPLIGTTTDVNGNFILDRVPVGRKSIQVSYIGYKPVVRPEILVSSGKEVFLLI